MVDQKKKNMTYIYSRLSGFNIYTLCAQNSDHFRIRDVREKKETTYYAVPVYRLSEAISNERAAWYADIIRDPIMIDRFEWPIDLVEIEQGDEICGCLVYNIKPHESMKPLKELLYQPRMSSILDWREPFIQRVCSSIASSISALHTDGYVYGSFDMNHILYDPQSGEMYFKFNTCIRRCEGRTEFDLVPSEAPAIEFACPYIYRDDYDGFMTTEIDDYQMTALLFRLMIGRLPYEGRDLMSYGSVFDPEFDTDSNAHGYYFRQYHQYPHFIFDERDETNSLSLVSDNDLPRERWAKLPEDIKRMFRAGLCQSAAEHKNEASIPTPEAWLKVLSGLGTNE